MAQRANTILDLAIDLAAIEEKIENLRKEYENKWAALQSLAANPGQPMPVKAAPVQRKPETKALMLATDGRSKSKCGSTKYDDLGRHHKPKRIVNLSLIHRQILAIMTKDKEREWRVTELLPMLDEKGLNQNRLNAHMNRLHRADYIRWVSRGTYRIAPSGRGQLKEGSLTSQVMEVFHAHPSKALDASDIAKEVGLDLVTIRRSLARLSKTGIIDRVRRGVYRLVGGS